MNSSEKEKNAVSFLIAQYTSLRSEIERRSKEQFACIGLSLTGLGIILALNLKDILLDFLPVGAYILIVLGLIWNDHAYAIHRIATFLRPIEEELSRITDVRLLWETDYEMKRTGLKRLDLGVINFLFPLTYFIFPSILILIKAFDNINQKSTSTTSEYVILGIGWFLLAILSISWIFVIKIVKFNKS